MRATEFIFEGAKDQKIAATERQYAQQFPEFVDAIRWAKKLPRLDVVIWYLHIITSIIKTYARETSAQSVRVKYTIRRIIDGFQRRLEHYLGYSYIPQVAQYRFDINQDADLVFQELESIIQKDRRERPIKTMPGDRQLFDYGNLGWWLLDRGYCEEEGRSGHHCGNVAGMDNPRQRIISLRQRDPSDPSGWHVILTFVLHTDGQTPQGRLGEMKARYNKKPSSKYHSQIRDLLLSDMILGIKGGGYVRKNNFSVFDFNPSLLAEISQKKPSLISDQIKTGDLDLEQIQRMPAEFQQQYHSEIMQTYGDNMQLASDSAVEGIWRTTCDLAQKFFDRQVEEMESDDTDFQYWQFQQALERGYYTSDLSADELDALPVSERLNHVDIDIFQVAEDPEINDYRQRRPGLKRVDAHLAQLRNWSASNIRSEYQGVFDEEDHYSLLNIPELFAKALQYRLGVKLYRNFYEFDVGITRQKTPQATQTVTDPKTGLTWYLWEN